MFKVFLVPGFLVPEAFSNPFLGPRSSVFPASRQAGVHCPSWPFVCLVPCWRSPTFQVPGFPEADRSEMGLTTLHTPLSTLHGLPCLPQARVIGPRSCVFPASRQAGVHCPSWPFVCLVPWWRSPTFQVQGFLVDFGWEERSGGSGHLPPPLQLWRAGTKTPLLSPEEGFCLSGS